MGLLELAWTALLVVVFGGGRYLLLVMVGRDEPQAEGEWT